MTTCVTKAFKSHEGAIVFWKCKGSSARKEVIGKPGPEFTKKAAAIFKQQANQYLAETPPHRRKPNAMPPPRRKSRNAGRRKQ